MKKFLFAFAALLALADGTARAENFVPTYTLDTFRIDPNSVSLTGAGQVTGGTVDIDEAAKQLRLTLNRHVNCPHGMMCIAMVPAPTLVTLPIQQLERDACGTRIVAGRNLLPVDGDFVRIEIRDNNASFACGGNADDVTFVKRVSVTVTERALRPDVSAVSELSGFPASR
jgi:hypothetical protein